MKNRTYFWSQCLVLTLVGAFVATPSFAGTSLRWKAPKVGETAQAAGDSSAMPQQGNPIQQVRYDRQQTTPIPLQQPSQEAIVDTAFQESRTNYSQPTGNLSVPTPSGSPLIEGNDLPSTTGDMYDDSSDDMRLTDSVKGTKIEISCPEGGVLKPISGISYDIRLNPGDTVPKECGISSEEFFPSRDFQQICFMWKASALCHKPLYFEEEALERYGHTLVREEFQPIISGMKFFLTIPLLPYKMGLNPPNECIYTLGHYRPGNCAPYMIDPLPLSIRAGLIEAGVIVGGVAILP